MRGLRAMLLIMFLVALPSVSSSSKIEVGEPQWIILRIHAVGTIGAGMFVNAMNGSAVWVVGYDETRSPVGSISAIGGVSTFRATAETSDEGVDRSFTSSSPLFQGATLRLNGGHDYEILMIGGGRNVTDSFYQFSDIDGAGSTYAETARGPAVYYGTLEDDYHGGALLSASGEGIRVRAAAQRSVPLDVEHALMGRIGFLEAGAKQGLSSISQGAWSSSCPCTFDSPSGRGTAGIGTYVISFSGIEATAAAVPDHLLADVTWPPQ